MDPDRLYESPFTDFNPLGVEGLLSRPKLRNCSRCSAKSGPEPHDLSSTLISVGSLATCEKDRQTTPVKRSQYSCQSMPGQKIKTLSQFTERVREIRQDWSVKDHEELWFRGESREHSTALQPKLYRPPEGGERKPIKTLLEIEDDLFNEFQRCGLQLSDQRPEESEWDWDWYFLMQHHGAPTRLLDWSDGALIALHFALKNKKDGDSNDAFVYVMQPHRLRLYLLALEERKITIRQWKAYAKQNKFYEGREDEWEHAYLPASKEDLLRVKMPKAPLLLYFFHITRRIAAQRSRFIVFGTECDWLSKYSKKTGSSLKTITIEAKSVPAIRIELRDSGMTESVIYPDLDGLGREISQRWKIGDN